jgi:putative Mg2+ transporter-C (MgtC) family protein
MPLVPSWGDISVRLALTVVAGVLIGLNRSEHGQSAGLRTTLLVGLAAAIAMIQMNLLLGMTGKTPDSFISNDLMRLPLGILSGIGFIGAGAILRQGDRVHGVTTAATLWIMTVIGLCFGGGQVVLGSVATGLAFLVLWALKQVESRVPHEMRATLCVTREADLSAAADIVACLERHRCRAQLISAEVEGVRQRFTFDVRWDEPSVSLEVTELLSGLSAAAGTVEVKWLSRGAPPA